MTEYLVSLNVLQAGQKRPGKDFISIHAADGMSAAKIAILLMRQRHPRRRYRVTATWEVYREIPRDQD